MPDEQQISEKDLRFLQEIAGPVYWARSRSDFLTFAKGLIIPSASGERLFFECMADFQEEAFADLAPSIHALRDGVMPPCRRFWIERTKKSSKDMDLAIVVCWLMAFPVKPFKAQIVAANSKQAAIVADRAIEIIHYNPWLNKHIEVVQGVIRNKDGRRAVWCRIEATGSAGESQGQTPDLLILNELVHVDKWSVMDAHRNNADGVPQGVVIISTNAGIKGSKAWAWRKAALANMRTDKRPTARWSVHILEGRAPWISEEDVEEARSRDPVGGEFHRLWEGKWISGAGAAVDEGEIDRAFCLPGPSPKREPGLVYVAGLDLGVSKDHAGMAVVGVDKKNQKIKVVRIKGWAPTSKQGDRLEVPIKDVKEACVRAYRDYSIVWFGYDPAAGGSFAAQDLREHWINMQHMSFSGSVNPTRMATSFVQVLKEGVLQCYEDEEGRLRRDIGKFDIKNLVPTGYRLVATADEFGHADVGTALVICLPKAVELMGGLGWLREDEQLDTDDSELDQDEVDSMPDVLRDIYLDG